MSQLNRYYLQGIAPALIIFIVVSFTVHFIDASFYMLGFVWPYSYYTPGLGDKLKNRYGRLSLLNLSYQAHDYLFEKIPNKKITPLVHLIVPVTFVALLSIIAFSLSFLWIFLGWAHFEVFHHVSQRYNKASV